MSHRDSLSNVIREGGGSDDLSQVSYTFNETYAENYDDNGVWRLRVEVFVPAVAPDAGIDWLPRILAAHYPQPGRTDQLDRAVDLTTLQLGLNTARFVVRDATSGDLPATRCAYAYYFGLRVPTVHSEVCTVAPGSGEAARLRFNDFCLESETFTKQYLVKAVTQGGSIFPPGY